MNKFLISGSYIAIFLLLLCNDASAYYYKQYTTSNRLISNNVYHSIRDSKGYMWFFTDKGVSKFDGSTFKNFTVSNGLSDHDIFSGYEDKSGRLWLYTFNGNPCFIQNDTVYNANNNAFLKKLPVISYIEFVYENADSTFYVGYINGQVIKMHKNGFEWVLKTNQNNTLLSMNKIGDTLKINKQISTISLINDKVIRTDPVPQNLNFHDYDKLLRINVKGLTIHDSNGLVWQYNATYLYGKILHIYYDKNGNVFCGTNNGLTIFNTKNNRSDSLFDNIKVTSTNQDLYGNYWITTMGNGVFYLNKNLDMIRPLNAIDNYKMYTNHNDQLFFIRGSKVYYFNNDSLTFINIPVNEGFEPLYIDESHFFFHDNNKTYYLDRTRHKIEPARTRLKSIYPIDSNRFLLVGINDISDARLQQGKFAIINTTYYTRITQSCFNNNTLYFSSNNVIYSYNAITRSLNKIDSLNSYQSISKLYLIENKLIITTNGENIICYDLRTGGQKKKQIQYPFDCYDILKMNAKGHKCILNTNKGYYIVEDIDNMPDNIQLLEYPLAGQDILSLNIFNNKAVCNLNDHYYVFDDSLMNKEKKKPEFFIEKISVNGKNYSSLNVRIKNSRHTHLSIALNLLKFDQVALNYEYRIIHDDTSQWYKASNDNLDIFLEKSGDYVIEMRAVTENNISSDSQFLTLAISPPFYYSFNFYVLVFISLSLTLFFAIRRFHQHRLKLFQNELNYLQLEHRSINSLLNPHFIFNAINNIQNLVNINSKDNANNYLAILSKLIRQNIENLQFSFIPVSRELALIRNYILLQNLRFDDKISLIITDNTDNSDHIQIPPLLIHTFVENSVVHGFKKEMDNFTINVELTLTIDDYLIIKVTDNGIGLSQSKSTSISPDKLSLGIDFIRKRLSRISDFYKVTFSLEIQSIKNEHATGAEVTVVLYSKFKNENNLDGGVS